MNSLNEEQLKDYLNDHLKIKLFTEEHYNEVTLAVGLYLDDSLIDYDYIYSDQVPNWNR